MSKERIFKKTKIIATIGPASSSIEVLKELYLHGANVFRINFSHGSHESHQKVIENIKKINLELNSSIGIIADLQGPKLRLGEIENNHAELKRGDIVEFTIEPCIGTSKKMYISYAELINDVKVGELILIDDGKLHLEIIENNGINSIKARVINEGVVSSNKGFNLPFTNLSASSLTEKDKRDIDFIVTQNVDWLAISFVRDETIINEVKTLLKEKGSNLKIISKIEKPQAIMNIDSIIKCSDALMIARGDLGVEIPFEDIPIVQKKIVKKCLEYAKPVIIATQVMESMITSPMPTRAEITDCANAVLDGADAIMVSGETSVGNYPVKVVETIDKIIRRTEEESEVYFRNSKPTKDSPTYLSDTTCFNAVKLSEDIQAKAINGMTYSGYTAFLLASFRPKADIHIFTNNRSIINSLSLIWGVQAYYYDSYESTDDTISDIIDILLKKNKIKKGEYIINTASMPIKDRGRTNMIKLSVA